VTDNILESVAAELRAKREATEKPAQWLDGSPILGDAVADSTGHPVDLPRSLVDTAYVALNREAIRQQKKLLQEAERVTEQQRAEMERRQKITERRERQEQTRSATEAKAAAARESQHRKKWNIHE
jgi:hypothetical protein